MTVAGGVVAVPVEAPAPRWDAERVPRVDIIKKLTVVVVGRAEEGLDGSGRADVANGV